MLALLLLAALPVATPPADLTALGVVRSPREGRSVALLRSGGRTRLAGVGEAAFGGRVRAIEADRVLLAFGAEQVEVRLGPPATGSPASAASSASTPAGGGPDSPGAPRPTAASPSADPATPARSMERREMERRLAAEMPRILAETALASYQDGDVTGFTVTRLPQGSLLADAGLRAGDVVTRINDVPIDSLTTLIGLLPRLQTESVVHAVVLRNGSPVSLSVTLR